MCARYRKNGFRVCVTASSTKAIARSVNASVTYMFDPPAGDVYVHGGVSANVVGVPELARQSSPAGSAG